VKHGVDGLVTPANNTQEFGNAIYTLVSDAELRARMSVAARESVLGRSWPAAFQSFWAATAT
jgi:glycosyltransferase involved in cell wall biosynthesis